MFFKKSPSLITYIHLIFFRTLDTHKGFYDYNYPNDYSDLDSGLSSANSGEEIGKISKKRGGMSYVINDDFLTNKQAIP